MAFCREIRPPGGMFICNNCNKEAEQKRSGYTNLIAHTANTNCYNTTVVPKSKDEQHWREGMQPVCWWCAYHAAKAAAPPKQQHFLAPSSKLASISPSLTRPGVSMAGSSSSLMNAMASPSLNLPSTAGMVDVVVPLVYI